MQREHWDRRYSSSTARVPAPARVLTENAHLLPNSGIALDLACGLGGDALFLAEQGLDVRAWDLSGIAVERLSESAAARGLVVEATRRDVERSPPEPESVDVLVVRRFLLRAIAPALCRALRPGGLLFYQTFTRERVGDTGPRRDAYRLAPGELWQLFVTQGGLRPLVYREEGRIGDCSLGFRGEALLVALAG